ncbi:unnamed protein product [Clonostachys rhizophaga]|uniref:DUF7702 domain-containing protein n=1 Tax=Clonostachys rhizophaga TaxID=160324 RepID=A0A9N9YQV0_9HYPO|nr:unnamed protein product [Clonostachys rhizophaga]
MDQLSVAQLAIYATLSVPTFYILWKRGVTGLLGWGYLLVFFSLRIVGCAMALSGSTSAAIISNIGLSPILLATAGILHEAQVYLRPELNRKLEWLKVILYHIQVTGGIALLAVGASQLQSSPHPTAGDRNMAKAGMGILTSAWAVLAIWIIFSCRPFSRLTRMEMDIGNMVRASPATSHAPQIDHQSLTTSLYAQLLISTLVSIPILGIRVIYSLVSLVSTKASDPSMAVRVVCTTLPEMIPAIIFCVVGLYTAVRPHTHEVTERNIHTDSGKSRV